MKKVNKIIANHIQPYVLSELELEGNVPILDTYGEGLIFNRPDSGKIKSYVRRDSKNYRELVLSITSLRGSVGAVHYYAKLNDYSLNFTAIEDVENKSSVGGYSTKNVPSKYKYFTIDLARPVTQKDIDNDKRWGREEYMISKFGDLARGFWTEDEAIETGIAVFKSLFKGKWKLRIDSYSGKRVRNVYSDKEKV